MIRFFYSISILVIGMGLPLLAKNAGVDKPTPSTNSKVGVKSIPAPSAALAKAKEQDRKKEASAAVVMTKDVSRGTNTPTIVAKTDAPVHGTVRPDAPAHATPHEERSTASTFVIRNSTVLPYGQTPPPVHATLPSVTAIYESDHVSTSRGGSVTVGENTSARDSSNSSSRLARVTAYWAAEGDYYTERCISSTGVRLHDGHCAVDPSIIPYGSVVEIEGVGKFLAVDTGSAVINRTAAREGGKTDSERHAIVVDLFFEDREAGERFEAAAAKYVNISWWTPNSMGVEAKLARSLFADENWTKIQGKQL
jgi:3D (Asp-Asp-Asp) domain-containing protein